MSDFYDSDMILKILSIFKVKSVVLSNVTNRNLIDAIKKSGFELTLINTDDEDSIKDNPLVVLPDLPNYDAIFIDGDANWYTVFNELNIVKESNDEFPLVFICNNIFPNKRRDSYIDPEAIPSEFRQKYVKELPIKYNDETINIVDEYFHACDENTPKNGVLTAIEDFLIENSYISVLKSNFIDGITILYPKLQINEKRINIINNTLQSEGTKVSSVSDKIIENNLLVSYINKYNEYGEDFIKIEEELSRKNNLIENYEKELTLKNLEVDYKDSQIKSFESKLDLKDSQIENFESKIINNEEMINNLESELESTSSDFSQRESVFNSKISSLESELESAGADFSQKETLFNNKIISLENKLRRKQSESDMLIFDVKQRDNQLKTKQEELKDMENKLDSLQHSYMRQLSKIDSNKYCIDCFKDEISNNHLEIKYLKDNTITKKILSPVAYLYLILKSKPKELSLNINLYKALKDSKCFDIGFYLNKNRDLIDSKWCKYFSPELHYVCNGFNEERTFNKRYFNTNSKRELLEYLLTCED